MSDSAHFLQSDEEGEDEEDEKTIQMSDRSDSLGEAEASSSDEDEVIQPPPIRALAADSRDHSPEPEQSRSPSPEPEPAPARLPSPPPPPPRLPIPAPVVHELSDTEPSSPVRQPPHRAQNLDCLGKENNVPATPFDNLKALFRRGPSLKWPAATAAAAADSDEELSPSLPVYGPAVRQASSQLIFCCFYFIVVQFYSVFILQDDPAEQPTPSNSTSPVCANELGLPYPVTVAPKRKFVVGEEENSPCDPNASTRSLGKKSRWGPDVKSPLAAGLSVPKFDTSSAENRAIEESLGIPLSQRRDLSRVELARLNPPRPRSRLPCSPMVIPEGEDVNELLR